MFTDQQETWIITLDHGFILQSLHECFEVSEFRMNRLSMEVQISLRFH